MSKHSLVLGIACAAALGGAHAASASTFTGRCVGAGPIHTGAPLRLVPAVTSIAFDSTGTCTGAVDGHAVSAAPYVGRSVSDAGLLSCLGGQVSGRTTLSIQTAPDRWTTLHLRFDDANVLGESIFMLRGTGGGLGYGQHQLTPDASLVAGCAGRGIDEVANTVSLATLTPFVG
jgi:hypothetical protein